MKGERRVESVREEDGRGGTFTCSLRPCSENGLVSTVSACVSSLVNLHTTKDTSIHQRQCSSCTASADSVVARRYVLASYLHVGGCWEECVSLVPTCRWVLGGMC